MSRQILGIDPGMTTGWVSYDTQDKRVLRAGQFYGYLHDIPEAALLDADVIVIERPVAHGATRPQVVDCAFIAGHLCGQLGELDEVMLLTRREVCKLLTDACSLPTEDRVRNDATAWAALKLLHGPDCDRKPKIRDQVIVEPGGSIGMVKSHERAALATAVAWHLREQQRQQ